MNVIKETRRKSAPQESNDGRIKYLPANLPTDPLPRCCLKWPLDAKFPMRSGWKDTMTVHRTKLAMPLYFNTEEMEFYFSNEHLSLAEYDPLHDPHLTHYLNNTFVKKILHRNGLVTCDDFVKCNLIELNSYRKYLRSIYLFYEKYGMQQEQKQAVRLRNRITQVEGKIYRRRRARLARSAKLVRERMETNAEQNRQITMKTISEKQERAKGILAQKRRTMKRKTREARVQYDIRISVGKQLKLEDHLKMKRKMENREEEFTIRVKALKKEKMQNAKKHKRVTYKQVQKVFTRLNKNDFKQLQRVAKKAEDAHYPPCVEYALKHQELLTKIHYDGNASLVFPTNSAIKRFVNASPEKAQKGSRKHKPKTKTKTRSPQLKDKTPSSDSQFSENRSGNSSTDRYIVQQTARTKSGEPFRKVPSETRTKTRAVVKSPSSKTASTKAEPLKSTQGPFKLGPCNSRQGTSNTKRSPSSGSAKSGTDRSGDSTSASVKKRVQRPKTARGEMCKSCSSSKRKSVKNSPDTKLHHYEKQRNGARSSQWSDAKVYSSNIVDSVNGRKMPSAKKSGSSQETTIFQNLPQTATSFQVKSFLEGPTKVVDVVPGQAKIVSDSSAEETIEKNFTVNIRSSSNDASVVHAQTRTEKSATHKPLQAKTDTTMGSSSEKHSEESSARTGSNDNDLDKIVSSKKLESTESKRIRFRIKNVFSTKRNTKKSSGTETQVNSEDEEIKAETSENRMDKKLGSLISANVNHKHLKSKCSKGLETTQSQELDLVGAQATKSAELGGRSKESDDCEVSKVSGTLQKTKMSKNQLQTATSYQGTTLDFVGQANNLSGEAVEKYMPKYIGSNNSGTYVVHISIPTENSLTIDEEEHKIVSQKKSEGASVEIAPKQESGHPDSSSDQGAKRISENALHTATSSYMKDVFEETTDGFDALSDEAGISKTAIKEIKSTETQEINCISNDACYVEMKCPTANSTQKKEGNYSESGSPGSSSGNQSGGNIADIEVQNEAITQTKFENSSSKITSATQESEELDSSNDFGGNRTGYKMEKLSCDKNKTMKSSFVDTKSKKKKGKNEVLEGSSGENENVKLKDVKRKKNLDKGLITNPIVEVLDVGASSSLEELDLLGASVPYSESESMSSLGFEKRDHRTEEPNIELGRDQKPEESHHGVVDDTLITKKSTCVKSESHEKQLLDKDNENTDEEIPEKLKVYFSDENNVGCDSCLKGLIEEIIRSVAPKKAIKEDAEPLKAVEGDRKTKSESSSDSDKMEDELQTLVQVQGKHTLGSDGSVESVKSLLDIPIVAQNSLLSDIVSDVIQKTSAELLEASKISAKKTEGGKDEPLEICDENLTEGKAKNIVTDVMVNVLSNLTVEMVCSDLTCNQSNPELRSSDDVSQKNTQPESVDYSTSFHSISTNKSVESPKPQGIKRRVSQAMDNFVTKLAKKNLKQACAGWIERNVLGCCYNPTPCYCESDPATTEANKSPQGSTNDECETQESRVSSMERSSISKNVAVEQSSERRRSSVVYKMSPKGNYLSKKK